MVLLCLCLTWTAAAAASGDALEQQSQALELDGLSDAEQHAALVHLSVLWAEKQRSVKDD